MNNNNHVLEELNNRLINIYGPAKASNMTMRVIPGIIGDFQKMLIAAKIGDRVTETYNLEDGRAVVILAGKRTVGTDYIQMIEQVIVEKL